MRRLVPPVATGAQLRRDESRLYEGGEMAQAAGGCDPLRKGASAGKLPSSGDAMNRVSTTKTRGPEVAQARKDAAMIIDFNGEED